MRLENVKTVSKDLIQREAILAWINNNRVGSIILPTGTGKTRVGVMAHVECGSTKTLVVTSRVPLINQWKKEFEDMNVDTEFVEFLCINSAYKIVGEYDLIIVDEVHKALSPSFRKLFNQCTSKCLLCLTATLPSKEEYSELLNNICPIVFHRRINDVKELSGMTSDFVVYNLAVPFTKGKAMYKIFDNKFLSATMELAKIRHRSAELKAKYKSSFDLANAFKDSKDLNSSVVKASKDFWTGMTMRKHAVYNNENKIDYIKQIVSRFPNKKWIVFTKSIAFAEKVTEIIGGKVYHSKLSKAIREEILHRFDTSEFNILVSVDALNEGLNIPDLDAAICASGVSTELSFIQQLGRVIRFKPGKKAVFINMYTQDTVEQKWVETKLKTSKIKSTWINDIGQITALLR